MLRNTFLTAAAAVGLLASAGAANASIMATLTGVTNSVSHQGAFDFRYSVTLSSDEQITTGSYLVLYDWGATLFPTPTSATGIIANNFAFTLQLSGPTPATTNPTDLSAVLNVTATYTGATVNGFALGNGSSGNLGTFVLTSPLGTSATGSEGSSAQHFNIAGGGNTGTADSTITSTSIPGASPVPEPASIALLGSALAFVGVVRRRRKG